MSIRSFYIKTIRKAAHSKGYGVHSPFAFDFISKVINNPYKYYFFDTPPQIKKQNTRNSLSPQTEEKVGRLLFRTVEFFSLRNIIVIGKQHPALSIYCCAPNSKINLHYCNSDKKAIGLIKSDLSGSPYLLLLDDQKTSEEWFKLFEALNPLLKETIIIAIPRIKEDKEKKIFWKGLCKDSSVHVTFDLYDIGIVFPRKCLHKKNYIVSF
ncbi:MAG: hypothetical protein PUB21_02160 [Bacteroidales bacterium]|nr:hypothetical protein [Bacteroidales bacterium]